MQTVDILGTEYLILHQTIEENNAFEECDGYCDPSVKKIYYRNYTEKETFRGYEDRPSLQNKVLRHEIIHAFMYESGLWRNSEPHDTWSMNEEMVLEENTQTRGTDFNRINPTVKHGVTELPLMVSTIYLTKSIVIGKAKKQ